MDVLPEKPTATSNEIEEAGHFPFRITERGESRYLTWIRDHSNYMAVRGWSDYFRAVSVLVRGALVNFLILLPCLLVTAIAVAAFKVWLYDLPFVFTQALLGVTCLVFVSFPARTFVAKLARYRQSQETGADSSVKQRDVDERAVGVLLVAVVAVAAFESLPLLLDPFHAWLIKYQFGWERLTSVVGAGTALYSGAAKLLSKLPRLANRLAMIALGALGIFLPLLVVLYVADFLCFGPPPGYWLGRLPQFATMGLPLLLLVGLIVGSVRSALSLKDVLILALLVAGSTALSFPAIELQESLLLKVDDETSRVGLSSGARLPALRPDTATRLARDAGPSFKQVQDAIKETQEAIAERRALDGKRDPVSAQPQTGLDPKSRLLGHLARLDQAAVPRRLHGSLNGLTQKLRSGVVGSGGDVAKLEAEVAALGARVAVVEGLLQQRDLAELVESVRSLSNEDLNALGHDNLKKALGPTKDGGFPQLLGLADQEFGNVLISLGDLSRMLSNARWEVRRSSHAVIDSEASRDTIAEMRTTVFEAKVLPVFVIALLLWGFCGLTVDVNLTSIHGLYRDRLASAFLVGSDSTGAVDIEGDLDLGALCCHEAGSTAPYHLINVTLNLQGSSDIGLRDRQCDFFIFSKKFSGGARTGYCRSESMERVYPQMSLASAMAISAAAASPNMGRGTNPALVALMTLLNIRLGIWVPNPGRLQAKLDASLSKPGSPKPALRSPPGFSFEEVFSEELGEIQKRWAQLPRPSERRLAEGTLPTAAHGLVGLAFSGGGIRSAALNLGIVQTLERRGVFEHVDYMSTVSGGGYLGSSISALMRRKKTEQRSVRAETNAPTDAPTERAGWRKHWARRSFGEQFSWQVPARALLWEMMGSLDENKRWVNLSDGGHLENLGALELIRRRCKYVIIGNGEADPEHRFNSLATLIRTARLDLGVHIDMDTKSLRLRDQLSEQHWISGRIVYPHEAEHGYLLYLKSSITGDEDEVIREYRHGHPSFPHESTADQNFDEAQFEAYRSLGQHIAEQPLYNRGETTKSVERREMSFAELGQFFEASLASTS